MSAAVFRLRLGAPLSRMMIRLLSGSSVPQPTCSPWTGTHTELDHFKSHRLQIWNAENRLTDLQTSQNNVKTILIKTDQGEEMEGHSGITRPLDVLNRVSSNEKKSSFLYALVDGTRLWDLNRPLMDSCQLQFVTRLVNHESTLDIVRRSAAFLLQAALEDQFGSRIMLKDSKVVPQGYLLNFLLRKQELSESDKSKSLELIPNSLKSSGLKEQNLHLDSSQLEKLTKLAKEFARKDLYFEQLFLSKTAALAMFQYNPFKVDYIKNLKETESVSVYKYHDFIDICDGPLLFRGKQAEALSVLDSSTSAEHDSTQSQAALLHIHGTAFTSKEDLKKWEEEYIKSKKRDHRIIGKFQKLFMTHPMSPGSIFMLPHGTRIVQRLLEFLRKEYKKMNYEEVITPMLYNKDLWIKSGHWANYKEDMFLVSEKGNETVVSDSEASEMGLKPMNCPGHCLIYMNESRSYRELPIRYADFSALHRNEASGALTGLTRVRKFHQDDAHIFCTMEQIESEIDSNLHFVRKVYKTLGFSSFKVYLSTRPTKFMGKIEDWVRAENALKSALNKHNIKWILNEGDGAFYGPKIDFMVEDAIQRSHQTATIQLDFQLPNQFDLKYVGEDLAMHRPVIIHRAVLGSVERMMAILIEHFAGKWPFWLSPRQAIVIPTRLPLMDYAHDCYSSLKKDGTYCVDVDASDNTLAKKVRNAQLMSYNYILVVGDREMKDGTLDVRSREGEQLGPKTVQELLHLFTEKNTPP